MAAARRLGIAILRVNVSDDAAAGAFDLSSEATGQAYTAAPDPDDGALILHASGTTLRAQIVPLLQSNIAASAEHIRASDGIKSKAPARAETGGRQD